MRTSRSLLALATIALVPACAQLPAPQVDAVVLPALWAPDVAADAAQDGAPDGADPDFSAADGRALPLAAGARALAPGLPQDWPANQDPRSGPRQRVGRRPTTRFAGSIAVQHGEFDFDDDFYGRDDSSARVIRFRAAGANRKGNGGGADIRIFSPRDDMYEGSAATLDTGYGEAFFYFMSQAATSRFRMPLRVGPYFSSINTELVNTAQETDYDSIGARFEVEPEFLLVQDEDLGMSIYSVVSLGLQVTRIADDITDEEFATTGSTIGFELGFRGRVGHIEMGTAFVYHNIDIDESDPEGGFRIPGLETEFHGIEFSMGVRF